MSLKKSRLKYSLKTFDGMKVVSIIGKTGRDGQVFKVLRGKKPMVAKVFRKNKNKEEIRREFYFLKKGYELGISPRVYGYNINENNYILMDELSGGTLYEEIETSGGKLSVRNQNKIIKILETLDGAEIFHGDISPLNFMKNSEGDIFIIDYGMAKAMNSKFIKKYGKNPNIKLGLSFFVLKIRKIFPDFEPKLIMKKIMSKLKLS